MIKNSIAGSAEDSTLDQLRSSAKALKPTLIQERECWSWSSGHFDWMDKSSPFVPTDTGLY